ncbi:MAG: S8 family serine peptidase [Thermoplasmata archaeon]|nr:S8 family serine peptidase [Thermoplasmata archaeon]
MFFSFFIVCSIVLVIGSSSKATGTLQAVFAPQEYVPHELLVKLKEDSVGDMVQSRWLIRNVVNLAQGKIKTYLHEEKDTFDWDPSVFKNRSFHADPYLLHIRVPAGIDLDYAISFLKSNPYVEYVEKNGIIRISTTPNDTYFEDQWGLLNLEYSGRDIHAEDAWDISTGNSEVIVAVLDSGIDRNHEDLQGNLWTNPNEIADDEDNDQNGFTDDLYGWDFRNGDSDPLDDNNLKYDDELGYCVSAETYHGTHVSGIIGAVGNNGKGIAGVCWNVKIMPLKISDACGSVALADATNALDYATSNGAYLSNNSYGGPVSYGNQSLKAAINRALAKNRLFVTSAGNSPTGYNIDTGTKIYPVCNDNENIVGVLATTTTDSKCSFSNYGPVSVDIGAPGDEVLSLKLGNAYQLHNGTSMASPHVAGVAALALGVCPGLTYGRLKDLIIDGADYVSGLNNKSVSEGRLNAHNVLNALGGTASPTAPSNLTAYPKSWTRIEVRWNDNSNNEQGFEIQRKDQYQSAFLHENSKDINSTSYAYFQDIIDPTLQKTYTYRVRAGNPLGYSSYSNTLSIEVIQW